MSNGGPHNTGTNQRTTTILRDVNGEIILEIGLEEFIVRLPDGSITFYRRSDNIQLVDGTQWNPGFLTTNPPIYIGVCEQCRKFSVSLSHRHSPNHGLVALSRAKLCECGLLCCPAHHHLCSDGRWRCSSCAKKYTVKELIKSIFFIRS